jgi:hypothetical protein
MTMRLVCSALIAMLGLFAVPANAQSNQPELSEGRRATLGFGRLFDNDYFGDNQDRWRTGSYAFSIVRGAGWDGHRPAAFGALLEYRLRTEIIAPGKLNGPGSDDRPYVGAVSAGLHTHFERGALEYSVGADLVATGPQTGIGDLQKWFHNLIDAPNVAVLDDQIGNAVHLAGTVELARPIRLNDTVMLRPFIEAQAGVEDTIRIGGDVFFGRIRRDDLLLRDVPTGQLYSGIEGPESGFGYVLGLDVATVGHSAYLPTDLGFVAEKTRTRARAGLHWQIAPETSFFYGLTYLSPEFQGQPEGQFLGSLKLNFNF